MNVGGSEAFIFSVAVALLVLVLLALMLKFWRKEHGSSLKEWEGILARLADVDRAAIRTIVALHADTQADLAPQELFRLLGGLDGLIALEQNCDVLVELATYVQRWHPEAVVVAEHLRINTRKLKWNVERLRGAASNGHSLSAFPEYAQAAVELYRSMTLETLALYETFAEGDLTRLRQAL